MPTSALSYLSSHHYHALGSHYTLVSLKVSIGHVQTISISVRQPFLQLVLPLAYHVYFRFKLETLLVWLLTMTTPCSLLLALLGGHLVQSLKTPFASALIVVQNLQTLFFQN